MIRCQKALVGGAFEDDVAIDVDASGRISSIEFGTSAGGDALTLGTVVPGFVNTHSHLFHRALRGSVGGDDFWSWRAAMYRLAGVVTPDVYYDLARGVYAEMAAAGYTGVGEFHYVHHAPDASPYPGHAMEMAIAQAAIDVGLRLVLLDTCYLRGGIGAELSPEQKRFGDGGVERWLERWYNLRETLPASPLVRLGAALHSVRALTPDEIAEAVAGLPSGVALHVHVSEQPRENEDCHAAWGLTPTQVLARAGAASPRTTFVHATHVSDDDIAVIAETGVTVSLCPTTEADLGDGIARTAEMLGAGVGLAIGSDQNVVIDPFAELRMLEAGARLSTGRRGVLSAEQLWLAGTRMGQASLYGDRAGGRAGTDDWAGAPGGAPGLAGGQPGLRVGDWADLVEVDGSSARLAGVDAMQWPLTATADDVSATVVGGQLVTKSGSSGLRDVLARLRRETDS